MSASVPPIAFLGVAERAGLVRLGNTNLYRHNILGLSYVLVTHFVPVSLNSSALAFAFYQPGNDTSYKLRFTHETGLIAGELDIRVSHVSSLETSPGNSSDASDGPPITSPRSGWTFTVVQPGAANILLTRPGHYTLSLPSLNGLEVGQITVAVLKPEPMTPERIAAIRSDPSAAVAVRIKLECNACHDACRVYTGLERSSKAEEDGWVWYETLPNTFRCSCGAFDVELASVRANLHALLGARGETTGEVAYVPLYEHGALQHLRTNFALLLTDDAPEEIFQKFIEANPVILYPFAPERIFFKAPILSLHNTDFAIVNHQRELLLIELEKPSSRILKKDGGVHSELQHAFDQARDWLHAADEHRAAVLECIGLERSQVGAVRAIVVAGRDSGYDSEHLRKLKGANFGRTTLLTYDDLLAGLDALLRTIGTM